MRFSSLALSAGLAAAATIPDTGCANPPKRVEWRTLGAEGQKQYVDAVLCLKTKPSGMGLNTTRYDDFPHVHTKLDKTIHAAYEDSLRDCGYTGPMAYWDWTLDTADVTKSPIWDPVTGFGGNGDPAIDPLQESSRKKCLVDGPLKGLEVAYTMNGYDPHCLARNWNSGIAFPGNMLADSYTKKVVDEVSAQTTYVDFRYQLEGGPHGAIHSAVGGDMSPATSPNANNIDLQDPIFFLHHAQIDRLWTQWQQEKPETRTMEFGGPKTQGKEPGQASLDDVLPYLGLIPDVKVSEVMSSHTLKLCYTY
ncbi:Tyrosinase [Apiospora saccharicola]